MQKRKKAFFKEKEERTCFGQGKSQGLPMAWLGAIEAIARTDYRTHALRSLSLVLIMLACVFSRWGNVQWLRKARNHISIWLSS
jgi:hypothetical protein